MNVSFIFASDIHGDIKRIDALLRKGIGSSSPTIILGGDLFKAGRKNDIDSQENFLRKEVEPRFSKYRGRVLTIFGNNDWRSVADRFSDLCPSIEPFEGKFAKLDDGTVLAGLSYVSPTPFMMKDWERLDRYGPNRERGELNGFCSIGDGVVECSLIGGRTMADEIEDLGDMGGKVLVSHGPPHGTCADLSGWKEHLGSMDLSKAITEMRPEAVLCGHIHEAPASSGKAICKLGSTQIANPGSIFGNPTCIIGRRDPVLSLEFFSTDRK